MRKNAIQIIIVYNNIKQLCCIIIYFFIFFNFFILRSVARCSSTKLYDLCWCLYLCAKNEDPSYNMDIVTSFHLLLCCIDLIYINVLGENRVDLINRNFVGIPEKWGTLLYDPQQLHNHCIIGALCNLAGALSNDAKDMKENHCNRIFAKFFKIKVNNFCTSI